MTPALRAEGLARTFGGGRTLLGRRRPEVHAVGGVTLSVAPGETLGVVGESGCGKTTLARMLVGLLPPSAGRIVIEGTELGPRAGRDPAAFGRVIQYVFQDPIAALNPRRTIAQILEAPLVHLHGMDRAARRVRIGELLAGVNLGPEFLSRYPHEVSGGQAQRIGIARALAARPRILLLDEPVSALDVSVQAQVLNLLADLKAELGLTYLFISHDLAVVETVSDRVAVMYFGRIVEIGPAEAVFARPRHPYTRLLAASAPVLGRSPGPAPDGPDDGELPNPLAPPPGCAFAGRCPRTSARCLSERPELAAAPAPAAAPIATRAPAPAVPSAGAARGHAAACHHPHDEG